MAYTKLFNSLISSTIWTEDDQTRIVWITILAMADKNGEVQASLPGLARIAGATVEATEQAIGKFLSPDPYSRTKDEEGRRLEEIDGGWLLINHAKYRKMASKDDEKEKAAERKRRQREREKSHAPSRPVTPRHATVTQGRDIAEAEAEADPSLPPKSPKGEWKSNEIQIRLNKLFRRKDTTKWSDKELRAFKKIDFNESDLVSIERYYLAEHESDKDYRRRDVLTLLNNWTGELDRARNWKPNAPKTQRFRV